MAYVDPQKLYYQQFIRREHNARRHKYNEELKMYNLIKAGDMSSMEDNMRLFVSSKVGHLSDNPLQDKKYLFVASTTLTTRFCIEGGMDEDVAYTASDLYIQRLDQCRTLEEVLTHVRGLPGWERFWLPPQLAELLPAMNV